ncbi:polysaccharide lyase 8 family protein [Fusobacterium sp. SYSU M8D902]|uniref:polysaccharide lyase 8 family protein n=1 Tax=Fusobacterium sp. SYSU M8D902 TaxID=3159562 RepID=UPI0032E3E5A8
MKKKLILLCAVLILSNTSFSKDIQKVEEVNYQEQEKNEIKDYRKIRDKWTKFLVGLPQNGKELDFDFSEVARLNEKSADAVYSQINLSKDRKSIFKSAENMTSGVDVLIQYNNLVKLAIAYVTPETKYYKNEKIKNEIVEALEWLYINAYHEDLPELGNWWQWELGIPKKLNEIITLMYEDISKENRIKYLKASEYFQPDAKWSGVSPSATYSSAPNKRVSTGGNRIDTSIISFMRGVLMEDKEEVLEGLNAAVEVGELVTIGDGFYRDGSFIQHDNVAYNGTYAAVLFDGLGLMLYLINGTEFKMEDPRLDNIYESILNGYSYLLINGGINDSVNGRSISRDKSSDIERARILIGSVALLSEGASKNYQDKLKELIKKVVLDNNQYSLVEKETNPLIKSILKEIVESGEIDALDVQGAKVFGAMDRAVYINDKDGKVVVSMHSNRVANYETMNGENIKGWYTGDGMTYIYGKDSSTYTEFWPTVDMYHLPGVTNSINKMGDKAGERRVKALVSPKAFVGGVEGKDSAFVGMDMISWNKQTRMKKSWFMIDGVTLALASNIRSNDGEIHTTIDNRILNNGKIFVNGEELIDGKVIENSKNLSINFNGNYSEENIGYRVIKGPKIKVDIKENKGSWKNIGGTLTEEISKRYFVTYMDHGKDPRKDSYAYLILPMFSKEAVDNYDVSRFEIVKLDEEAHIVKDRNSGVLAMNFWKDSVQEFENIKVFSAMSIIKNEKDDILELYVSDPTQLQNYRSILEIKGNYKVIESSDKGILVKNSKDTTKLEIDLRNNGSTQKIVLQKLNK